MPARAGATSRTPASIAPSQPTPSRRPLPTRPPAVTPSPRPGPWTSPARSYPRDGVAVAGIRHPGAAAGLAGDSVVAGCAHDQCSAGSACVRRDPAATRASRVLGTGVLTARSIRLIERTLELLGQRERQRDPLLTAIDLDRAPQRIDLDLAMRTREQVLIHFQHQLLASVLVEVLGELVQHLLAGQPLHREGLRTA